MLYVSPAYELIWGRSTESLYAHPHQWVEAILPEDRERVFAIFSTLQDGAVRRVSSRVSNRPARRRLSAGFTTAVFKSGMPPAR